MRCFWEVFGPKIPKQCRSSLSFLQMGNTCGRLFILLGGGVPVYCFGVRVSLSVHVSR